eukprot:1160641-Pelagomonas_calceolata.AAC.14
MAGARQVPQVKGHWSWQHQGHAAPFSCVKNNRAGSDCSLGHVQKCLLTVGAPPPCFPVTPNQPHLVHTHGHLTISPRITLSSNWPALPKQPHPSPSLLQPSCPCRQAQLSLSLPSLSQYTYLLLIGLMWLQAPSCCSLAALVSKQLCDPFLHSAASSIYSPHRAPSSFLSFPEPKISTKRNGRKHPHPS